MNKKGFSLVELIIVIAIMVALIAVMGPQYVKYVQSSRDAVVGDAAESVLSVVKAEYSMNNLSGAGTIVIGATGGNGVICIKADGITTGAAAPSGYSLYNVCGVDAGKTVKSDVIYTITVSADAATGADVFSMVKGAGASSLAAADVTKA